MKANLKLFKLTLALYRRQPWLEERESSVMELIDSCTHEDQLELVIKLLNNFNFLDHKLFIEKLTEIANYIVNIRKFEEDKTILSSFTFDGIGADSGQLVIQYLKPIFSKMGWKKPFFVNLCTKSTKHIKQRPNLVLIDEFIGSGKTIKTRIDYLTKSYQSIAFDEYLITVCVVACMKHSYAALEKAGFDIFSTIKPEMGISGHFTGDELEHQLRLMLSFESTLMQKIENKKLPSLGFGGAEALYAAEDCNATNSLFPLFWWPKTADNKDRKTILERTEI